MITIRISILLAFSLLPKATEGTKAAKGKKSKKETKSAKKSDKSKKSKKSKKKENVQEITVVEKPKNLIEVENPIGFAHVEYDLIPGRPKYQVDVVCWGTVAKVFSADGDIILKCFVKDNTAWIPLTIKHILNHLDEDDLLKLHTHVINYMFWTSKNKLGARAKSENTKAFFILEEDVDSQEKFIKAYIKNPSLEKFEDGKDKRIMELEKEIKSVIWECADVPGAKNYSEIVTRLEFLSDPLHSFQVNKIIDNVISGKTVEYKHFVPVCPPPTMDEEIVTIKPIQSKSKKIKDKDSVKSKKSKDKSSKKGGVSKGKKGKKEDGLLKIVIPGEVFYTDPNINIYDLEAANTDLTHAYVLTTVNQLMNRQQKYSLNHLVIKIKKLSNLPVDILQGHRFSTVHAYYNIPFIAQCTTIHKSLAKTIKFDEAHVHFTDVVPKLKLLEFLQSQRLYIELRGVREGIEKSTQANIFGCEKADENISKRLTTTECSKTLNVKDESTMVTLAVACYDLSSLLKPTWDFLEKASCHHPDNKMFQNVNSMYQKSNYIDSTTINEVNLGVLFRTKSLSPLSDSVLTDFGTTLKVEVYLSAPPNTLLEVHANPEIYHRMLLVVNYLDVATTLLNAAMLHNQQVLGPEMFVVNFLKDNPTQTMLNEFLKKESQKTIDSVCYSAALTGFVIDNGKSYAFFLEGLANGYLLDIWGMVMEAQHAVMKSFYNTDFCFERRIYSEFLRFGGLYVISLKIPLENIMDQYGIYLEGNTPIPTWEALQKFNLLFKCVSMRAMIQYCLLPTPIQLLSLDMEWGVPFQWKKREINEKPDVSQTISVTQHEERITQLLCSDDIQL